MERTIVGSMPALLCHYIKILFKKPPILKMKWCVSSAASGMQNSEMQHREMIHRGFWERNAPFSVTQGSIEALISGHGPAASVRPCISWTTVSKIDETTLLLT